LSRQLNKDINKKTGEMVFDNLKFIKSNQLARQISFQDDSGGYLGRTVTQVLLAVKDPFDTGKEGLAKWDSTTIPTHTQIKDGKIFEVDSQKLGLTTVNQSYYTFKDGVLNFDYYVGFEQVAVTGAKGDNFVIGSGFIPLLEKGYDGVIINGKPYALDLSKPTNAGTVLYLFEDLPKDITSLTFAERSNLKLRNNHRTKCAIGKVAQVLIGGYRDRIVDREIAVQKLVRNEMASKILFEQEDYLASDKLLKENVEIIKWMGLWD